MLKKAFSCRIVDQFTMGRALVHTKNQGKDKRFANGDRGF